MTTTPNTNCHHDALVSITDHRDLDTLNQELINSLHGVLPQYQIRFYACDDHQNFIVPENNEHDTAILKSITSDKPVLIDKSDNDNQSWLFPIYANTKHIAALIIEGNNIQQHFSLINSFISLYANQFTLLNSSNRDALTGLYNRQAFDKMMGKILAEYTLPKRRCNDKPEQYFFALLDIDRFKSINDNFGHLLGDEVLLHFAQIMMKSFRDDDLLFRYGGEEFAVALQTDDEEIARMVFERFRNNIEKYNFPQVGKVTVSIGYTKTSESMLVTSLTEYADKALYYAKEHGRNQVHCYETLVENGSLVHEAADTDVELF